jgi:heme-degrading monooxygenase HmoA
VSRFTPLAQFSRSHASRRKRFLKTLKAMSRGVKMSGKYACVWEFMINHVFEAEFIRYYSQDGIWAELFRQHPGYIGTFLLKDHEKPGRYLTIDRWQNEESFHAFKAMFAEQYEKIDQQCVDFTIQETSLGSYFEIQ